jgi:membrane-associated phospholipid phosphatase
MTLSSLPLHVCIRLASVLIVSLIASAVADSRVESVSVAAADHGPQAGPRRWGGQQVGRGHLHHESVALRWNSELLAAVRAVRSTPVVTARALAIVHTCMYDAWAAYDARAVGTVFGSGLRRPPEERTLAAKEVAVSFAAFTALVDLIPSQRPLFERAMEEIGLDSSDETTDPTTPAGVGHTACTAVLEWRHHDGSNQLGDMTGGAPYSDYTDYLPLNSPTILIDPNRWQPLVTPAGTPQAFLAPHWRYVTPFALARADQFRPRPPAMYPSAEYFEQAEAIRLFSASLDDRKKVIAEYWSDGPGTETPPGHWNLLAQFVSRRDHHDLDADVKMFFVLGNALLDVSVAVWDCKAEFDSVRPVSAVRFLYAGQLIEAWGGPGRGRQMIPGDNFQSYIATPPFAEYTSGHSAFSAASATVLRLVTGSPYFGATYTFSAGTSTIEPGITPARDIVLSWRTFDDAADQAGLSRRYGGIHFRQGDLESRHMGRSIGLLVWQRASAFFRGHMGSS